MKTNKKTIYIESGLEISIQQLNLDQVKDNLTPAIYTVAFDQMHSKYFLKYFGASFNMPSKIYGDVEERSNRILKSYENRNSSTGVLLYGLKGSGKTLLMKNISNQMLNKGFPVIIVNSPYSDSLFLNFISLIEECVIIFDEFAKVYGNGSREDSDGTKPSQQSLLPLFDGTFSGKRLILVSENNKWNINPYFLNRPGRILYRYVYDKLQKEVVTEYCKDNQLPDDQIQKLLDNYEFIEDCSFDIISTIINEYKIHQGDILDIIKALNIDYNDRIEIDYSVVEIIFKESNSKYLIEEGTVACNERLWDDHGWAKLSFDFSIFDFDFSVFIKEVLKIEKLDNKNKIGLEFYDNSKNSSRSKKVAAYDEDDEDDYLEEEFPHALKNVQRHLKGKTPQEKIKYIKSTYTGFDLKGYFFEYKVSESFNENLVLYDIGPILLKVKKIYKKNVLDSYESYWTS